MRSEVFFNAKGVIYMNYVPKGKPVNAEYVKKSLARFLDVFRQTKMIMLSQEWFLHRDNVLVHTADSVQQFLAAKGIKPICHPPYSLDLAPADFFLFSKARSLLASLCPSTASGSVSRGSCGPLPKTSIVVENNWHGIVRTTAQDEYYVEN